MVICFLFASFTPPKLHGLFKYVKYPYQTWHDGWIGMGNASDMPIV